LLYDGRAYLTLGQKGGGVHFLEQAVEFCSANGLNQLLFEGEAALADVKRPRRSLPAESFALAVDEDLNEVALAIGSMKQLAGIE